MQVYEIGFAKIGVKYVFCSFVFAKHTSDTVK